MFVDASAICAILLQEPDGKELILRLGETSDRLTSPMSVWESVIVLANRGALSVRDAHGMVTDLLALAEIKLVAVPPETAALAVEAFERYGKGRHPAALNFGDCFSYACARHFRVPLLYKGDDFGRTDIATAAIGD